MRASATAAVITVGSELVEGLRVDTNTAHVARRVARLGFRVTEATSVGDDVELLSSAIRRLSNANELVVVTGGLGPTHDDVTRDATSVALGIPLAADPTIESWLSEISYRHVDPASRRAVLTQALVLAGAEVLWPTTGTAPGQVVLTGMGCVVLLPGPPSEMGEMLDRALSRFDSVTAAPLELGVVGMAESDVQHAAQRALVGHPGVTLTVLAKPGDVRVVLIDSGATAHGLDQAADAVAVELGLACYSRTGETLAEATVSALLGAGLTLATAESCTGGLVSAAITDVPGSSSALLGGFVTYANEAKIELLDVPGGLLAQFGAVSEQTAIAMAEGARTRLRADIAVSVTGIAGPDGGSEDKPVGLVWFAVAAAPGTTAHERRFIRGSRASIRARATATALDLVRRSVSGD